MCCSIVTTETESSNEYMYIFMTKLYYGSRIGYMTFSVLVNLKDEVFDDISMLITGLWSSVQQCSIDLDGLAVHEHLSVCRWNVR